MAEEAGLGHFLGVDHARGEENIGGVGRVGNGYVYRGVGGVAALAAEAHADRRNILADGEFIIGALSGYTGCTQEGLSVSATTTNQLSATGFTFDSSGNMLTDGLNTYGWNAESEIKSAAGVNYTYDGDGNRLQKSNGKIYWYGAGTEILDESDASGNFTNEYVFFGGKRVAMRNAGTGTIYYYAEDMLGSSRTLVQAGQTSVCYDADFYPFGGERDIVSSCTQDYKFEGKERDTETNNDDFGARYYASRLGRWLSADWSAVPAPVPYANLTNPQTLNLYAMVRDNPETFADLDGHVETSVEARAPRGPSGGIDDGFENLNDRSSDEDGDSKTASDKDRTADPQASQQPQGQTTLNLGGTKVDVSFSAGQEPSGRSGVDIYAAPQNSSSDCRWAQTVTRTGDGAEGPVTDRRGGIPGSPLYPPASASLQNFSDAPRNSKGGAGAGTFTAVATLGVANKGNKTFRVIGSMTYGYRVDKNGHITASAPRVATRAEQARSVSVLRRESPTWKIGP